MTSACCYCSCPTTSANLINVGKTQTANLRSIGPELCKMDSTILPTFTLRLLIDYGFIVDHIVQSMVYSIVPPCIITTVANLTNEPLECSTWLVLDT